MPRGSERNDMPVLADPERCPQDHRCPVVGICPAGAISQEGFGLPVVDDDLCLACGKCTRFCPTGAFVLD